MFDGTAKVEFENVLLEKIKYQMEISFPHWHMQGSLSKRLDYASSIVEHAVYQFETFFWGKQEKRTETKTASVSWPSTWWDHWKEEHAPKWFKERWPVKYSGCVYETEINNYETRVCPHLNLSTPDNKLCVAYLAKGNS